MSRVGFILKPDKTEAGVLLEDLVPWLRAAGHVPVVTTEDQLAPAGVEVVPEEDLGASVNLAVVLGGDGTMLRAARVVADQGKPILGINLGSLGFLTQFSIHDAKAALDKAIAGKLQREQRMRLAVRFVRSAGTTSASASTGSTASGSAAASAAASSNELVVVRHALNDAVLHQGAMARLVEIEAFVDDQFVAAYRADGLIVSTPTGSTAYNMAAGGPIVVPGQAAMTLTPICAHALTNRPLVIPANATIRLGLAADVRGVMLTVDAQWAHSFLPGDFVEMTAAATPLVMFRSQKGFFDVMRDKLHWGAKGGR